VPAANVVILEQDLAPHPPFTALSVADYQRVLCVYPDGRAPFVLHQMLKQKPWLTPMRPTAYSELLPRLWLGRDVAIRLPEEDVPIRFRTGALAAVERRRAAVVATLRQARPRLGLRSYVDTRRRARQRARGT